jgi:hypothetical protein
MMTKPIDSHSDSVLLFETARGAVRYCLNCHKVSIEFENLLVDFMLSDFLNFRHSLELMDFEAIAEKNACLPFRRKLIWEFQNACLKGAFHLDEVAELIKLVTGAESSLTHFHLRGSAINYPIN